MKVLHVVPSFYPAFFSGGPIQSVHQLCRHLVRSGCKVKVLTTDANGPGAALEVETEREVEVDGGLRVRYCRRVARDSVSPALLRLLPSYIRWAEVVHLTAVYSSTTIPTLVACRLLDKPVVWSPRGALQRWEGSTRVRIKALWERVCRVVAPRELVLHVTSDEEAKESLERVPGVKAALIPNGIEIPEKVMPNDRLGTLRLLYLGRLDPKKGIENLLEACKMLQDGTAMTWSLTVAGAGDPRYTEAIRARIERAELSDRVRMVGRVGREAKRRLFENADLVVIPSHTENFGLVVAEALAHGVPVIASRGTPWERLEEVGCGLWVDNDPNSLAQAFRRMNSMPLREMGQRGRQWMMREFTWHRAATRMVVLYETQLRNGRL